MDQSRTPAPSALGLATPLFWGSSCRWPVRGWDESRRRGAQLETLIRSGEDASHLFVQRLNNDPEEFQALRVVRVADGVDVVKSRRSQVAFREQSDDPAFDVSGRATRLAIISISCPTSETEKLFRKGSRGELTAFFVLRGPKREDSSKRA